MSKYIFFILLLLVFTQEQSILDYFNKKSSDISNEEKSSDCLCNTESTSCNYLCCCDVKCGEAIDYWRNRSLCVDEKDTVNIFADRCIDKHLVVKVNKRRGLKKETATEDISNSDETITNYCFSMDNSEKMTKDIKSINFNINKILDSNDNKQELDDDNNNDYLNITDNENKVFVNNESFSLYSEEFCTNSKKVEKFVNANYSCLMNSSKNELIKKAINNNDITINGINNCDLNYVYQVKNGLLSHDHEPETNKIIYDNEKILEIEFLILMGNYDDVLNCSINLVKSQEIKTNTFIFKNSVFFLSPESKENKENTESKVPYRYSGTNGYLNGYPLKVAKNENETLNEYYIIGRDQNGNCRIDDNTYDYLYYIDKPILFNQNYSYSCNLTGNSLEYTTLFKKINNTEKIAKYGDSKIKKLNDTNYWIDVDKTGLNANNTNNTLIKMNIYIGTKKIGIHSFKYIYKVIIKNIPRNDKKNNTLTLDINYYDLDKKQKFEMTPDFPAFIPSMPGDLLDPLIYSEVDK